MIYFSPPPKKAIMPQGCKRLLGVEENEKTVEEKTMSSENTKDGDWSCI